jgi:hypothetical protein
MKQHSSTQEYIIHNLSQRILGPQTLFYPDNYKNSREPADIAWVSNRCAILMYVTESQRSYEQKRDHNLKQLNRWLRTWENGQILAGRTGTQNHQFSFEDVDHVIGLSIVDGGETWCEYHSDRVLCRSDSKLAACATFTGPVMRTLSDLGAGPRDILFWIDFIRRHSQKRVSEQELISAIVQSRSVNLEKISAEFPELKHDSKFRDHAIRETLSLLAWSIIEASSDVSLIGSDLTSAETLRIGFANAALETHIAPPGADGTLIAKAVFDTGIYKLECVMSASLKFLVENGPSAPTGPGLTIVTALDFGRNSPIRMMLVSLRTSTSHLEQELAEIRRLTFCQEAPNPNTS